MIILPHLMKGHLMNTTVRNTNTDRMCTPKTSYTISFNPSIQKSQKQKQTKRMRLGQQQQH
jgi:hypothetical protein